MADLFSILSQSSTSLDAQQAASQTTGQNISNANTPGYTRQTAVIEAVLPADLMGGAYIGQGAQLETVTQTRDQFIEAQVPAALAQASSSSAQSAALTSLSALDPTAQGSLATALGNFYASLETWSQNPGDPGTRQATAASASGLALAFNNTAQGIIATRDGLDTQLQPEVSQANSLASQIASLNAQIRTASANGASPNDLLDARRQAQDQLEQLTGAQPVADAQGDVNLFLPGGVALVDGNQASALSTIADASNNGHLAVQITLPGGSATSLSNGALGGTIGGQLSARDGALLTAENQVDQLAFDVGSAVNGVQTSGFTAAGAAGQPLFNLSATSSGAASQIQVSSTIANDPSQLAAASTPTGGSGDGSNVLKMLATSSQTLSSGTNASDTLSNLTAAYGAAAQQAQNASTADAAALQQVTQLRDSASGVNINDEMTNLDKTQRVYQAIGRVISAADAMLDTLMQIT